AGAKEDPVERDRFLGHIERESGRLARLARAMLTLARAHSGQEQPRVEAVELRPLLREVAAGLRPHAGVAVDVDAPAGLSAGAKEDPVERDRFLGHIERESGRLARLARAMLTLARAHSGQEQPRVEAVELRPLLREVAAGLRPHAGVAVDVDAPAGLSVDANRDLLEQTRRNLGENAAKHTARGSICLRARSDGGTV